MIRRSRISVRPNVRPASRPPTASRDASQDDLQRPASPSAVGTLSLDLQSPACRAAGLHSVLRILRLAGFLFSSDSFSSRHVGGQNSAPSPLATVGTQRRKRISVLPNVAKPRTAAASTPASAPGPAHAPAPAPVPAPGPAHVPAPAPAPGPTHVPAPAPAPAHAPAPAPVPGPETESLSANQEAGISCSSKELQTSIYESPSGLSESWPAPSERKTIVLEKQDGDSPGKGQLGGKTHPRSITHIPLALMTLNDPGDRLRLARAKKLRELLKKAMRKDKVEKQQRPRVGSKEPKTVKDHTKMTMRELIYYLPPSNPMTSYTEDEQRVTEMVLPSSPTEKPLVSQPVCPEPVEAAEEDEEMVGSRLEEDESLLAPRVKVAEDGSLIIDEESLTVEVLRVKGPNPAEERDPIFERGSTTTYSSFRKGTYTKPWSIRETDMFFLAISMVGTDFSMISQLFPHRARIEIKFKKEERTNSWRIDKAFSKLKVFTADCSRSVLRET
uniref:Zgc:162472 n=1 Tax=Electrophorus electricus TaxID=8005 RepID=A0A4W4FTL5_ELEEL